jgi:hypothetical protein
MQLDVAVRCNKGQAVGGIDFCNSYRDWLLLMHLHRTSLEQRCNSYRDWLLLMHLHRTSLSLCNIDPIAEWQR